MVDPETAGDPLSQQKWVRSSLRHLSARLAQEGKIACAVTTGRLLRKHHDAPKVNVKRVAGASHPDRHRQFEYLTAQKQAFLNAGQPGISVDTFKNAGACWCPEAEAVNLHDFPQDALGRAVPYGLYDVAANRGAVYVGQSADTPEFAVTAIASWGESEGAVRYPEAQRLLILCDAGGSNGWRPRAWKQQLQEQLSDRFGLCVTVCHSPTRCSKWNPIEYRLFSPISRNWAGKPLRTFETVLACLRGTTTQTGLTVSASLLEGVYAIGQKVSNAVMHSLNLHLHLVCPRWNYTLKPRLSSA